MSSSICGDMKETKRQVLPAGLWVVATPIGNLNDLTPRALTALDEADLILCEDTRRTSALLSALGRVEFLKRLERMDAHTEPKKIQLWVERLQRGTNIAVVTDAGTPSVSDPGSALVAAAHEAGIRVSPVPGPSAPLALLSVSGFQGTAFLFRGFFPRSESEQKKELARLSATETTQTLSDIVIWFESPFRIVKALQTLAAELPGVRTVVAKELTKLYEQIFTGPAHAVAEAVATEILATGEVGEWCFAVQFPQPDPTLGQGKSPGDPGWEKALQCLLDAGISASDSAKRISQTFGVPKKVVYLLTLGRTSVD